jgi:hypothetical protein
MTNPPIPHASPLPAVAPAPGNASDALQVAESDLIYAFNSGYLRGHNDTVEGCFTDVAYIDYRTYHADVVQDLIEAGDLAAPVAPDPLAQAVEAMVDMLESKEWAEHVSTIYKHPLASRLESAITDLVGELHEVAPDLAGERDKVALAVEYLRGKANFIDAHPSAKRNLSWVADMLERLASRPQVSAPGEKS